MLTRKQKIEKVGESKRLLEKNKSLVFVDFAGVSVKDMERLRRGLKVLKAELKVIKKRLLRIAMRDKGVDFDPEQFELQLGTVFSPSEIFEIAGPVYKSGVNILGGYDLEKKDFLDAARMKFLGQLPSKEVLLGQLVGMIAAPIKMFLSVLDQKSKKV